MRAILKISVLALLLAVWAATVSETQAQLTQIYARTNVWKYNIACQDTTGGWETTLFDDSAWSSGPGGFTGGETAAALVAQCSTLTLPAPNSAGRLGAAMYFRTHFNVATTNGLFLTLSNAVDDGAVIYLNGTRIVSLRGPVADTCAAFSTGAAIGPGTDALLWEVTQLSPDQLGGIIVPGDNIMAVSVHQTSGTSSDMVFAQALMYSVAAPPTINYPASSLTNRSVAQCSGSTTLRVVASGSPTPTYQWTHAGTNVPGATNITYAINNATLEQGGAYNVIASNPSGVVTSTPNTVVTVVPDTAPPQVVYAIADIAAATVTVGFNEAIVQNPDFFANCILTDTTDNVQVPVVGQTFVNPTTVMLSTGPLNDTHTFTLTMDFVMDVCAGNELPSTTVPVAHFLNNVLVNDAGTIWKYNTTATDLGTAWVASGFDDSAWTSGAGVFDGKRAGTPPANTDCRATVSTLSVLTCIPLSNTLGTAQIPAAYFRKHFTFGGSPAGAVLRLRGVIDDGVVYYLNGVELLRVGMPTGPIAYATLATRTIGDGAPETNLLTSPLLVNGANTLAVEVHQSGLTSSDLTFALDFDVYTTSPVVNGPTMTITQSGGNVTVTWSGGGTLQSSTNISNPANWTNVGGSPTSPYTTMHSGAAKFYRVTVP